MVPHIHRPLQTHIKQSGMHAAQLSDVSAMCGMQHAMDKFLIAQEQEWHYCSSPPKMTPSMMCAPV